MSGTRIRGPAHRARLPLLDRLLDADPGAPEPPPPSIAVALDLLHRAVRRDLEAVLNARRRRRPVPAALEELVVSPLNYGIPDATSGAYAVPARREALAREVEATIRRFEPRLMSIRVELVGGEDELDRALRLKVDAVLRADPVPEPVSFETLLEPVSRDVTVRDA
ncbi:type VI secretion system baseplate subunit TssE [Roseomonas frigidaquae]|uniref:Type VI secretion system baseplate subunit TssE n=1 Tax=Falsiroseomonas frigidaquae TaxID=487318 RepID=A0ABX1F3U3_9PROT|nr:type VI secretion system baseplate subunit TssE [Falsiroseomonas frigidaquae]NKE46936.1 type VI secretion system baseplate subunit TssE [Falsiroseomonas frigidaquae]